MRLLLLGGTEFVGRAVTEEALARGWDVTVFHRGHHAPPEGTTALHGDRLADGGLAALATGAWDAVVDTWSAAPRVVRDAARLLADRCGRYVYVSSRSVYASPVKAGADEDAPVVEASPDAGATAYGEDKRGGELAALESFADRALLVRAGLILGPHENIGRLPWWLNRTARGGPTLAPGPRDLSMQYIDVRDLAAWTLGAIERNLHGPFNLVSRPDHTTTAEFLETCARVTGGTPDFRWRTPEEILAAGVEPWQELPCWLPPGEDYDFMHRADVSRALSTGLTCRPFEETAADTWSWLRSIGGTAPQRPDRPVVGLAPAKEAALLA